MSLEGNNHASSSTTTKKKKLEPASTSNNEGPKETSSHQALDEVDIDSFIDECQPYGVDDGETLTDGIKINHSSMDENDVVVANDQNRKVATNGTTALSSERNVGEEEENESKVVIDQDQKRLFDQEKEEIMRTVPKAVKKRFGEIRFATFGSYIGPVLILDPYNISAGPVRDQWLKMYHKVSQSKQIIFPHVANCSLTK
jgi:hypothetical protein